MPLFKEIFTFFWFHAFVKNRNMFDVFALRNGQTYNSLIARTHPMLEVSGLKSKEHVINEHTIAYLHLCVVCSLEAGVGLKRHKTEVYNHYVSALTVLNGQAGQCDWRKKLAEKLTKWDDTFKTATKTTRDPTVHLVLSLGQVNVAVDESDL